MKDDHPAYRAQFYITELKKYATWSDYLAYYREQDDKIMQFNNYCLQQWTQYMERIGREQKSPLSFKEYVNRYKKLLEYEYNAEIDVYKAEVQNYLDNNGDQQDENTTRQI